MSQNVATAARKCHRILHKRGERAGYECRALLELLNELPQFNGLEEINQMQVEHT